MGIRNKKNSLYENAATIAAFFIWVGNRGEDYRGEDYRGEDHL